MIITVSARSEQQRRRRKTRCPPPTASVKGLPCKQCSLSNELPKLSQHDVYTLNRSNKFVCKNIYTLNPNYSDFIELTISISSRKCTFLIDTQADIHTYKSWCLKFICSFRYFRTIQITGITDDPISSLGFVDTELIDENFLITHPLHVVSNSFHIPSDGILGKDFLKRFMCDISYRTGFPTLWLSNQPVYIPIAEGPVVNTLVLGAVH